MLSSLIPCFKVDALEQHLIKSGCTDDEKFVWLAEDGSAIVNRIELQSSNGQICGFVQTIDSTTGMPITHSYPA